MHASVWRESIDGGNLVADTSRTGIDLSSIGILCRAWAELVLLSVIWGGTFFTVAIAQREMAQVPAMLEELVPIVTGQHLISSVAAQHHPVMLRHLFREKKDGKESLISDRLIHVRNHQIELL